MFQVDDVLLNKLRPYLAKVYHADFDGVSSGELLCLRSSDNVLPRFLFYVLVSKGFIDSIDAETFGSKMPRADWEIVGHQPLPLPALETQRRIAQFLDAKTARIDGLIEKKRALLERLAEKRQALITRAVTKGLNSDAPMKPSGIDWLGDIPAHWEVLPVKRVSKLESGHTPDKKIDAYWDDCQISWVSLNDTAVLRASDYISDTTFKINELGLANSSARLLPARAVVFTRDATIGESAITTRPMAVSQHIIAWLCNEDRVIPEYLLFTIYGMTGELMRLTNGSTIGTIGLGDVKSIRMVLPPIAEQRDIVAGIVDAKTKIDEVAEKAKQSIQRLHEYRSAIITAAVTGQIGGLQ
jgi:type I restriction enzyme S subunit